MATSAEFWRDQSTWPRDTPEMVFMARAAIQLGKTLVDGWTGEEFTSEPLRPIDRATDARTINNIIARHLPQFGRREYRFSMAPVPIGSSGSAPPTFTITPEERRAAEEHIRTHNSKVAAALDRKRMLQDRIANHAMAGNLRTVYRLVAGGGFVPVLPDWWNTERLDQRFAFCSVDPDDPFGSGRKAWLFLSRANVDPILLASDGLGQDAAITNAATTTETMSRARGKIPLVHDYFRTNFPAGVPGPAHEPRKELFFKVQSSSPQLKSISDDTLGRAIKSFNLELNSKAK
jgi:hypothetical protein